MVFDVSFDVVAFVDVAVAVACDVAFVDVAVDPAVAFDMGGPVEESVAANVDVALALALAVAVHTVLDLEH